MFLPTLLTASAIALWSATHEDESWRDDVIAAAERAGLSRKEMAAALNVTEAQLSDQLALRGHLSEWRMRRLPRAFHRALYRLRLERWGDRVIDDEALRRLIDSVQVLIGDQRKRMAKADLPPEQKERIA